MQECQMSTDRELLLLAAKAAGARERHGMNKSPEHCAWVGMRQRCNNPKKREFRHYGGRGISVCVRWSFFANFLSDMGLRPTDQHSIDRIDVNGNYEPGNVRWAIKQEQAENTTVAKFLTYKGETKTMSGWERTRGFSKGTICRRLKSGWTIDEAIGCSPIAGQKIRPEPCRDVSWQARGPHGNFVRAAAEIGRAK
jgi:hypothetical protein